MLDIPVIVRNKALAAGAEQWARGPSYSRRRPRTRLVDCRREAARGWYRGVRHRSHVRRRNSGSLEAAGAPPCRPGRARDHRSATRQRRRLRSAPERRRRQGSAPARTPWPLAVREPRDRYLHFRDGYVLPYQPPTALSEEGKRGGRISFRKRQPAGHDAIPGVGGQSCAKRGTWWIGPKQVVVGRSPWSGRI